MHEFIVILVWMSKAKHDSQTGGAESSPKLARMKTHVG
jgi:hypothetical protein